MFIALILRSQSSIVPITHYPLLITHEQSNKPIPSQPCTTNSGQI
ncbi:MAG: hypothetical protein AAGE96_22145 [Cyanobacteria bacterium P01_G01_bin.19]